MKFKCLYLAAFTLILSACASVPPELTPAPSTRPERADRGESLLRALLALGIDYQPGGSSPTSGFDCSGLVAHVFREAYGIRLPHSAHLQSEIGRTISLAELEAGDLVFYDTLDRPFSHVGIYIGDGRFVHAPKAGARVRIEKLESPYWTKRFNGARRVAAGR
jgi:cell wall-associated NlpC family hydrolase